MISCDYVNTFATMKIILFVVIYLTCTQTLHAQCIANAGTNIHICSPDSSAQLGGNPTAFGGVPPYVYEWWIDPIPTSSQTIPYLFASNILDDTTSANPTLIYTGSLINDSISFYLKITDSLGCESMDTIKLTKTHFGINLLSFSYWINQGDSVYLDQGANISGGWGNTFYSWSPTHGLSDSTVLSGFWAKPDSSIAYSATVTDSKGCQKTGSPFYFIYVNPVGIDDINTDNQSIIFYPNPTTDIVFINMHESIGIKEIKVLSLNGQEMISQNKNTKQISLKNIPNGVYIIEIHTSHSELIRHKIVKK